MTDADADADDPSSPPDTDDHADHADDADSHVGPADELLGHGDGDAVSSESSVLCPRCGEPLSEHAARDPLGKSEVGVCDDCYFDQFELVDAPERLRVEVCARCGAVHRGNRWVDVGAKDYTDVAIDEVAESLAVHVDAHDVTWEVDPEQVDQNNVKMHCSFSGVVRGQFREAHVTVPVSIARQTCQRCGRIAGDYYASVVQVRAVDRLPDTDEVERAKAIANELVADMEATGSRDAFVSEMADDGDGLNVKLSTTNLGKKVASKVTEEFGGDWEDHETLVTEDEDGNEVYRVTYAVRLPEFRPGDVIDPEDGDGPILVRSVQGNLKGLRLASGERFEASYEVGDAPDARKLGTIDDGVPTTLVAYEDEHAVQVLDPETYQSTTVARPDYLDADPGTEVPVLRHRNGLHVLPDE
ncbi:60S ribosomal export protein NMD3 [Halorubellus salinus]|uniref:60S ribosomal export protein NMD3 n=1 Tax=Halorubellus salinus TaxID=755309 RepID=UPI001D073DD4|nr:60S ribosomal export protein NMD3 [Halorubellus salinus]